MFILCLIISFRKASTHSCKRSIHTSQPAVVQLSEPDLDEQRFYFVLIFIIHLNYFAEPQMFNLNNLVQKREQTRGPHKAGLSRQPAETTQFGCTEGLQTTFWLTKEGPAAGQPLDGHLQIGKVQGWSTMTTEHSSIYKRFSKSSSTNS